MNALTVFSIANIGSLRQAENGELKRMTKELNDKLYTEREAADSVEGEYHIPRYEGCPGVRAMVGADEPDHEVKDREHEKTDGYRDHPKPRLLSPLDAGDN